MVCLGYGFIGIEYLLFGLLIDNDSMVLWVLEFLEVDFGELCNIVVESIYCILVFGNISFNVGNFFLNK